MTTNPDKLHKKALADQQRRLKPTECQKYVRLVLNTNFSWSNFGRQLLTEIENSNLNHTIRSIGENCIAWERNVGQREFISNDDLAMCNEEWEMEAEVVKIIKATELNLHVNQHTLVKLGKELRDAFPQKRLTFVVPRGVQNTNGDKDKDIIVNDHAKAYVELLVMEDISVIEIKPNVGELFQLLRRFTKAIAEAPYKEQKAESLNAFKKYLGNDKKDCVRVVGTNGFGRLWQQHLNRLPLVTLEIAEAIIAHYSCPKKLLDTYRDNREDAIEEIANIRLNRGIGPQPLQKERRIGNALSTKLYTLYNSRDPDALI